MLLCLNNLVVSIDDIKAVIPYDEFNSRVFLKDGHIFLVKENIKDISDKIELIQKEIIMLDNEGVIIE